MSEPADKPQGFTVIDRRGVEREPTPEPPAAPAPVPAAETKSEPKTPRPPIDFTTFVLSFASTALVQMGEVPDPESGQSEANIEMARETIDILGMLRDKTRGNLTSEETRFFDAVLYDLRVRYVEASKPKT